MIRRVSAALLLGSCVGAYLLPEEYYPGPMKPVNHMLNVVVAGVKMGYVYKFSSEPIHEKNVQASTYLKQGLQKSGGIYIKLGQLIATLDVIVPDEFRNSMMTLTRSCSKSKFHDVKRIIEAQLHQPLENVFIEFDPEPISSASIGQVHRARLKSGEEVAVKVQHSNLYENVQLDLKLMWGFVKIAKFMFKDFKYAWLIEEFDKNIHKQLDFEHEASNMRRVEHFIKKEKLKNILVPKILLPPTKKLLVMEFIHGFHIDEVEKMKSKKINLKSIGKKFANMMIKMIHQEGFVHGDPHSGNLLVRKSSKNEDQLYILDHGLYQELTPEVRDSYNRFWLGLILNKEELYARAAKELGTQNGTLLCSMLTSQSREELQAKNRKLFDLNPGTDRGAILIQANKRKSEIVSVLNELSRQILLLLKVNEFARAIQNMLGGRQMGVYEDIARCCVQNLPISWYQKQSYFWQMFWVHK